MDGFATFAPSGRRRRLAADIACRGTGLHTGRTISMTLRPAAAGAGIAFLRADLGALVPATFDNVGSTRLCTSLGSGEARVDTVEHVMAALAAAGVDDAIVELDGPEVPILDGSAEPFLFLIGCAGLADQPLSAARSIEVVKPVRVGQGEAWAELLPNPEFAFDAELSIDFAVAPAIGRQSLALRVTRESFARELAAARTFTLAEEVRALRAAGLALGGGLHNAVVVDGAEVLNPEGLRSADEFVRHKLLDVVGDLALAGAPLAARFRGHRTGHALNNQLLRALMADRSAWRFAPGNALAETTAAAERARAA
jgi:UDP-3-O-[3-hydroxymyristoyl] N-acetylglucosamine deacetylase